MAGMVGECAAAAVVLVLVVLACPPVRVLLVLLPALVIVVVLIVEVACLVEMPPERVVRVSTKRHSSSLQIRDSHQRQSSAMY